MLLLAALLVTACGGVDILALLEHRRVEFVAVDRRELHVETHRPTVPTVHREKDREVADKGHSLVRALYEPGVE